MTQSTRFNAMGYADKLEKAGMVSPQAKVLTEMFSETFEEITAVKEDIAEFKKDVDIRFAELKADIDLRFSKVDTKFSDLKSELIKWMTGIFVTQFIAQAALVISLLKFLH